MSRETESAKHHGRSATVRVERSRDNSDPKGMAENRAPKGDVDNLDHSIAGAKVGK